VNADFLRRVGRAHAQNCAPGGKQAEQEKIVRGIRLAGAGARSPQNCARISGKAVRSAGFPLAMQVTAISETHFRVPRSPSNASA
jgi:hypothetical protein